MPLLNQGHTVVHLVEALHYQPERRGFISRLRHWNFSLTWSLSALWPWGWLSL